jgi:hypothetical protein
VPAARSSRVRCARFDWFKPNGELKDMTCRVAMLRMQADGLLTLPAAQRRAPRQPEYLATAATDPLGGGGDDGQPAMRSTGRWWAWLQARGPIFAFSLRCRFRELGRASDFTGFWRQVFATLGLPRAMAWLDREMSVP